MTSYRSSPSEHETVQLEDKIPILVLACNRVNVTRCLDLLIQYRPSKEKFPIIISQDCNHEPTRIVLERYANAPDSGVSLVLQPDLTDILVPPKEKKFRGYFNIARHYRFALNHTFHVLGYESVIIVEDDLDISSDFYEYFLGTYALLKNDPTLWCVSAWNDNGKVGLVDPSKPELLHRSDFFPGLGWMLRKQLWDELQPKWPPAYWDDWIRKPEQRKDRACIRPELPRTKTFGKIGVSNGLFFEKYLKYIQLNDQSVPFTKLNLSYLMKSEYDKKFMMDVNSATEVTLASLRGMTDVVTDPSLATVRLTYTSKEEYKKMARHLGLMEDFRSGVGRTAYLGVVNCFYKGRRVYIAPDKPNFIYDPMWS
ncbi:alpha-1,3-mannosyl-glycoprotein 2-beta-N-acetylglucosaminyltransferase isoform X2 [Arctopsyche grandis]|uniref:alpha-1,3-mannosyl-glycoprotein 2-beta-N-acetylglucosaminyltransferase isoform X2 n=1 Tax=Arctopsyche grandis TaxID=121162 RepID=UPI00406D62FF